MSRIDQALRNWESSKGAIPSPPPASDSAVAASLAHYPSESREEKDGGSAGAASELVPEETPVRPIVDPVVTSLSEKAAVRQRDNAYLAARLVTGASNPVSLGQYRRLAAILHESQVHSNLKTLMVTSALPGEGKSLTVANLAFTLSGSYGRRVLVVDADLRAPSLHQIFGIRNSVGLSEALRAGRQELPFVEVSDNLSVLTAGKPGPTPLADLISDRMGEVIRECASRFDWVLVDSPPVGLLPDAQVLARFVGGVVFVIAAGSTPSAAVERAVSEVGTDCIIGTVLNRIDDRRIPEADYYNAYYGGDAD